MRCLRITAQLGAVVAVRTGWGTGDVPSGVTDGKPVDGTLFNDGQR